MLRELIDKLRMQDARGLITRMGYASGSRDADIAKKLRPNQSLQDTFFAWPQLRAIQGSAVDLPALLWAAPRCLRKLNVKHQAIATVV
jgi:hypothetical protein